ncbi:MAG: Holliday junction branch migration protein RuvA [Planctomycetes bacterium]|nr:Holliday junction branch migration protein RuvA [Planctomycetota bacterium]MBI3847492.1 Holliday junction branch migration protein RuvA [Planctomycetota bacterium]
MFDFFEGEIVEKQPTSVVLNVDGVGYRFTVPLSTSERLGTGGRVRLLAHLHVREDAMRLYGFATAEERILFEALIGVSGIGPAVATAVLSGIGVQDFVIAVETKDETRLRRIKGIGAKTAQRILLELGDSLPGLVARVRLGPSAKNRPKEDALLALESLGFSRAIADKAVERALGEAPADEKVESLVRRALRYAAG